MVFGAIEGVDMKILCIYHGNCADGFGAAWVVRKAYGDQVEFHAGIYQDDPPDVTNRDVLLVDFSYKKQVIEEMAIKANTITIIDHHKTAYEELKSYIRTDQDMRLNPIQFAEFSDFEGSYPIRAIFDMEKSGAGLAWDFFFQDKRRPSLIDYIEDRDLWKFKLSMTRNIQACLFSYPYDFEVWDKLMETSPEFLANDGAAIERKHHKDIAELVKVVTRPMKIGGHIVPAANLPYTLTSDAGHLLCGEDNPFAACYWDTPDGRVFSLRSRENGLDVGEIAKQYGGGGHIHASGFRVSFEELEQFNI